MSPRLRPLRLPAIVEQRRKFEEYHSEAESDLSRDFDPVDSSSDAVSPVTPTFSSRGHLRYSSSTSSFEFTTPGNSEPPSSPTQVSSKSVKPILPDVEEEPMEHYESDDDQDPLDSGAYDDLYDCLCTYPALRSVLRELIRHCRRCTVLASRPWNGSKHFGLLFTCRR